MSATTLLGGLGTVIGLVRALPQLVRLARERDAHGVSLDTAVTSSIVSFGWATYGVLTEQPAVALATGASGIVFAAVSVLALRLGRGANGLRAAPVWFVALATATALSGSDGLGLLLPVSVLIANVPQIVAAYRENDLTGLSAPTWLLSMSDGAVWLTYSLFAGDVSILVFGILQLGTSAIIVARRWRWERGRRTPSIGAARS
jgi:uncharacterized protein with PQ loop repeat